MKKFIKYTLITLAALFAILVIVVAGVYIFVDPNDYKEDIAQYVQKQIGREVSIKGDLGLSVFPWLGVKLGECSIGNPPGFEEERFAQIQSAAVQVRLWPLIQKEVQVGTISLKGFELNLLRTAQGKSNWEDLLPQKAPADQKKADLPKAEKPKSGLAALAIGRLEVKDAQLTLQDRMQNNSLAVRKVNLGLGPVRSKEPFDVSLAFNFSSNKPALQADVQVKAKAEIDLQESRYELQDLKVNSQLEGQDIPGEQAELDLQTDVLVQMKEDKFSLQELVLNTYGLKLTGKVDGSNLSSQPQAAGQISLASFDPQKLLSRLGMKEIQTAEQGVLGKAEADCRFAVSNDHFELQSLKAVLDETTIEGKAKVSQFKKPDIDFNLQVDSLDADRYLPKGKEKDAEEKQAGDKQKASQEQTLIPALPLNTLRSMQVNGNVVVGKLKAKNLRVQNVNLEIKARDGIIRVEPLSLELYQGKLSSLSRLDVRRKTPAMHVQAEMQNVQAGELLKDYAGKDFLSGRGKMDLDINTAGMTQQELTRQLNGQLSFKFEEGAIKGVNIPKKIRDTLKRLQGQKPDPAEEKETDFALLSASANITDGLLKNEDLVMKSPIFEAKGAGTADLTKQQIDYALRTTIAENLQGRGGQELQKLAGMTIPIRITGFFQDPSILPILKELLPQLGLEKGLQQFEGGKELKQKLKGLQDKLKSPDSSKGDKKKDSGQTAPEKILEGIF
jgi:AsmA protein